MHLAPLVYFYFSIILMLMSLPIKARAQYQHQQFAIEAGGQFSNGLLFASSHGILIGVRGALKASDHWWYAGRALVLISEEDSLRQPARSNTLLGLQLTPLDMRYYFLTERIRPFIGGTSSLYFFLRSEVSRPPQWGLGPVFGIEIKIDTDIFWGLQVYATHAFAFEGPSAQRLQTTTQLMFFF